MYNPSTDMTGIGIRLRASAILSRKVIEFKQPDTSVMYTCSQLRDLKSETEKRSQENNIKDLCKAIQKNVFELARLGYTGYTIPRNECLDFEEHLVSVTSKLFEMFPDMKISIHRNISAQYIQNSKGLTNKNIELILDWS